MFPVKERVLTVRSLPDHLPFSDGTTSAITGQVTVLNGWGVMPAPDVITGKFRPKTI